jgi:hypothetical protein
MRQALPSQKGILGFGFPRPGAYAALLGTSLAEKSSESQAPFRSRKEQRETLGLADHAENPRGPWYRPVGSGYSFWEIR